MLHAGGYFSEIVAHTYIWTIVFGFDSKSGHIFFPFPQHLDMLRVL